MKAKDAIQLFWAIDNCIECFFKENRSANPKEFFLSIKRAGYGWKETTGNPFDVQLLRKEDADIFAMPCLYGLYEDVVDEDSGEVVSSALLGPVSEVIDEWLKYNS